MSTIIEYRDVLDSWEVLEYWLSWESMGSMLLGYMIGSVPVGVIISKIYKLGDLRKLGSGSIGATNVLRTGKLEAALLTLGLDFLKGLLCGGLILLLEGSYKLALLGCALSVIGHCYSVWISFRGGKGVATFLGFISFIFWGYLGLGIVIWLLVAFIFRYSSLASMASSVLLGIVIVIMDSMYTGMLTTLLCILVIYRHRDNIVRLVRGEESKIRLRGLSV